MTINPRNILRICTTLLCALAATPAVTSFAQQPPPGAEAKPPAEEPRWLQGRPPELKGSTLAPLAPHMAGRPAKDLPVSKLKVPPGFHVEVFADGIPDARSLTLGSQGTVFVSNRNLRDVYAIVDRGGKREVKKVLTGISAAGLGAGGWAWGESGEFIRASGRPCCQGGGAGA